MFVSQQASHIHPPPRRRFPLLLPHITPLPPTTNRAMDTHHHRRASSLCALVLQPGLPLAPRLAYNHHRQAAEGGEPAGAGHLRVHAGP